MTKRVFTLALLAVASLDLAAFTFSDIHYWVGEGANQCAVVVDWGEKGKSLAWGYKWNGSCTNLPEVVRRIVHEDPRLVSNAAQTFFGYDVADCHPSWNKSAGTCGDEEGYAAADSSAATWRWLGGASAFSSSLPEISNPASVHPASGQWFALSFSSKGRDVAEPIHAESPYGYEVVDSFTTAPSPLYKTPANVLGHPTMGIFTSSSQWGDSGSVINPAYPAWSGGRLFSLGGDDEEDQPGYVTIKFDHDVIDDPRNPWGIDFIVFGNALTVKEGTSNVTLTGDPATVRLKGIGAPEPALVEVSQDGETWLAYEDGPFADDYMPTLGYTYDPANADPCLFNGNLYWGRAAQATRPVNPECDFSSFAGISLAEACRRYAGSAGGTGFDLARLPLARNAAGRKWIRYVRISSTYSEEPNEEGDFGFNEPEVDAVADVAPVSEYELWAQERYTNWATAWRQGPADAIAENGLSNAMNFAWGIEPTDQVGTSGAFAIRAFRQEGKHCALTVESPVRMYDAGGIRVSAARDLASCWTTLLPTLRDSVRSGNTYLTTFTVPADAGVFFKLTVPTE